MSRKIAFGLIGLLFLTTTALAQKLSLHTVATNGWANNSVNTVIFRKNALTSYKDLQYIAYYDDEQFVVLGKRKINTEKWELLRTKYKGDASDAHKSISIMVDGIGVLHLAWGQHNNKLNYAKAIKAGSLEMGEKLQMLGEKEGKVSYPEFYKLANGDVLFFYRDGGSGNGNLMINRYQTKTQKWVRVQDNLIDGEGIRNAYIQTTVDVKGTIHVSWVWRESPDVASNHDLCYAKSTDGGLTWQKSTGDKYQLPINATNAEYALKIPQNSELINQTSMFADENGYPFIATYWREQGQTIPQYHLVYKSSSNWEVKNLGFRKTAFTLSGGGTKKIPIARPQLITWKNGKNIAVALIYRDIERGSKVSMALNNNLATNDWKINDLTDASVGEWEPAYDTDLWAKRKILNLFVQKVEQVDGEGKANNKPTAVQVLSWKP
ncbi:MAG: neuraminidase [Flavobacterium sp.]|nr:MAG: neuraminidase [Flavobacterium sp.]